MKATIQFLTTTILLLMATTSIDAQTTRYVDPMGSDSGGCTNSANPCATINYAIDQAGTGDIIDLAAGVYTESLAINKSLTLQGAGNTVGGGSVIQSNSVPDIMNRVVIYNIDYTYSLNITLSGLVIRYGSYGASFSNINNLIVNDVLFADNQFSTALSVFSLPTATLSNITFENNIQISEFGGSGVASISHTTGEISLTDINFINNTSLGNAGALYIANTSQPISVENVNFTGNSAGGNGGALYLISADNVSLNNVVFNENEAGFYGGAVFSDNSSAVFTNVQLIGNEAATGGGIYAEDSSELEINNAVFLNNEASHDGGGFFQIVSSATIVNSLFANNKAGLGTGRYGGGINNNESAHLTLINTTITGNEAGHSGGGILIAGAGTTTSLLNTIVWGNTAGAEGYQIATYTPVSAPVGAYNLFANSANDVFGGFTCTNCTNDAPDFADPGAGDYQLSAGSPAVDAGDPATDLSVFPGGPSNPVDLNGAARVHGGTIDMGAYEFGSLSTGGFQSMESITLYPNPVNDLLHIESEHSIDGVTIYDLSGKRVLSSSPANRRGDRVGLIDLSGLTGGVYVLKISAGGRQSGYRVVKR